MPWIAISRQCYLLISSSERQIPFLRTSRTPTRTPRSSWTSKLTNCSSCRTENKTAIRVPWVPRTKLEQFQQHAPFEVATRAWACRDWLRRMETGNPTFPTNWDIQWRKATSPTAPTSKEVRRNSEILKCSTQNRASIIKTNIINPASTIKPVHLDRERKVSLVVEVDIIVIYHKCHQVRVPCLNSCSINKINK